MKWCLNLKSQNKSIIIRIKNVKKILKQRYSSKKAYTLHEPLAIFILRTRNNGGAHFIGKWLEKGHASFLLQMIVTLNRLWNIDLRKRELYYIIILIQLNIQVFSNEIHLFSQFLVWFFFFLSFSFACALFDQRMKATNILIAKHLFQENSKSFPRNPIHLVENENKMFAKDHNFG